ncbi:aspartic proteinase 36-like [Impatiens glandulifera]|uniref:aspartic proteinase 36-like n=1 Tax=Impatiens glandulifera TaxID=253017 RepID=UPI001FB05D4D|nr:aspartic proteinase 36-like [Impatiens glandulifera]
MPAMPVPELLSLLIFIFVSSLAKSVIAVQGVGHHVKVLALERTFPADQRVELDSLKARDRARHARILQGSMGSGGVVDFSVSGSSDPYVVGLYYTKVKLGSPPREFNVQIDTGSDILWVNGISCTTCPQLSGLGINLNFFDAASSSTSSLVSCSDSVCTSIIQTAAAECAAQNNQCGFSFSYGDGSGTSGYYLSDLLHFDSIMGSTLVANYSAPIIFGYSNSLSGELTKTDRAIDGIFGFGQHDLSVISQLSSQGITPRVFSHCLKGEGNNGGILVLGEILDPRIVYSPLVPSQPHYNLYLQSIAVNGQLLPIDEGVFATSSDRGTIVDSGTTLSYLVAEAYDPFVSAVSASVLQYAQTLMYKENQCYLLRSSINDVFPFVALNFAGGASMVLKPQNYLIDYGFTDGKAIWCMGFQRQQDRSITILGDLVLKDRIVVYDIARRRLGWADYDCSLSVNVSITSGKDLYYNGATLSVSSSSRSKKVLKLILLLLHILLFSNRLL